MSYRIGLIGLVGDELRQDRWGTLEILAAAGYQGIEGGFLASDDVGEMRENRRRLDELGLSCVALSCRHANPDGLEAVLEKARVLGAEHIVTYWGPAESEEQLRRDADVMEGMAQTCADAGVAYCYHNHEHEFTSRFGPKGTTYALEILADQAPTLQFELDIGWCHFGGVDPVRYLRTIGHRVPIIHVKDFWDDSIRGRFTSVGTGVVNCMGAIEAAAARGTRWMVVEQDKPHNLTGMESALAAIFSIREAGLHPGMPDNL